MLGPPVSLGATKDTDTSDPPPDEYPLVATTDDGAPGTLDDWNVALAALSLLHAMLFCAATVQLYVLSSLRAVTDRGLDDPVDVRVVPPSLDVQVAR